MYKWFTFYFCYSQYFCFETRGNILLKMFNFIWSKLLFPIQETRCQSYIDSLVGIISPSEFETQVRYLINLSEDKFKNYVSHIKSSEFPKTKLEIDTLNAFLDYIDYIKVIECPAIFYNDVMKLRYRQQVQTNEKIKLIYGELFQLNKMFLWSIVPYGHFAFKEMPIDVLHEQIENINENTKLETALRQACVLHHEDKVDSILNDLNRLLVLYQLGENEHPKAGLIFRNVMEICEAVIALKEHGSYDKDTGFCDIKMFFNWKLKDFKEFKIRDFISSFETLLERKCKEFLLYKEKKEYISTITDSLLKTLRNIISCQIVKIDTMVMYPYAFLQRVELKEDSRVTEESEIVVECKFNFQPDDAELKKTMKQMKYLIKTDIEEIQKNIVKLDLELQLLLAQVEKVCYELNKEIALRKNKLITLKDIYNQYVQRKKLEILENKLKKLSEEENAIRWVTINMDTVLYNLDSKGFINEMVHFYYTTLWDVINVVFKCETEHEFLMSYSELYFAYKNFKKGFKKCTFDINSAGEFSFFKGGVRSVNFIEVDIKTELKKLKSLNENLEEKFKTMEELKSKNMKFKSSKTGLKIKDTEKLEQQGDIAALKTEKKRTEAETDSAKQEMNAAEEEEKRAVERQKVFMEETEFKLKILDAKSNAYEIFYKDIKKQGLKIKELTENIKEILWQLYTFAALCENFATDFESLSLKCRKLKEDLESSECQPSFDVLDRLAVIQTDYDKLCNFFTRYESQKREHLSSNSSYFSECEDNIKVSVINQISETENMARIQKHRAKTEKETLVSIVDKYT